MHEVEHHTEHQAELDWQLEAVARADPYAKPVAKLSCLRGISTLSALALVAEIGDFRRFESPRQLMAFIGLVPREYSSGGKKKRGGITKTGNKHIRRLLVEAAWSYRYRPGFGPRAKEALRGRPPSVAGYAKRTQVWLRYKFMKLVERGKKSQLAITAVAREPCGFTGA